MMSLFLNPSPLPPHHPPSGWRRRCRCGQRIRWRDSGEGTVQASGSAGSHRGCKEDDQGNVPPSPTPPHLPPLSLQQKICFCIDFCLLCTLNNWPFVSVRSWKRKSHGCWMQTTRTPQKTLSATTSRLGFLTRAVLSWFDKCTRY